jgi:pilus assembly protein FimV
MTIRKWPLTLALAPVLFALLYISPALALGLGGITVNSVLNEPLDAEIALSNVGDADQSLLRVELASAEAFAEAGVIRDYYLTQLNFYVGTNGDGEAVINVSSDVPVRKSYLNFLVKLEWPAGRLIREYTLLLTLPDSRVKDSSAKALDATLSSDQNPELIASSRSSEVSNSQKLPGESHVVVVGDTLWNVSKRLRPRGLTILQTMDALYSNNSDSFVGGDANRMKKGAVLRLPSVGEIGDEQGNIVADKIGLKSQIEISVADSKPVEVTEEIDSDDIFVESDFADDRLLDEADVESEAAANVEYDKQQEITDLFPAERDPQAALLRKTQLENEELRARMALLETQEERRRTESQSFAGPENAVLNSSKRKSPTLVERGIVTLKEQQWYVWAAVGLLLFLVIVLIRRPKAQDSEPHEAENAESEATGDDSIALEPRVNTDAGSLLDGVDGLDLDADNGLFDETDKEIFAEVDDEVSGEIFDSMVEAVSEAEVYLSLGNLEQAVRILEEARAADSKDTASRLKLMEIFYAHGRRDELQVLYLEVEQIDDEVARAIAAGMLRTEQDVAVPEESLDKEESIDQEEAIDKEESIDQEDSAASEESLGTDDLAVAKEPSAEPSVAVEGFGEIDISDLLDGGIEPGDYNKIDALSESVLGEDFLDDSFMGGGIFAETPTDENASEMDLPNVPELDRGIEFGGIENLYDSNDAEAFEDIDAVDVKLDLANTYIEMGDPEGAREILNEIIGEADEAGQAKARAVLESM